MIASLVIKEADEDRCPQCGLPWYLHPMDPFDGTDRACRLLVPEAIA